MTVEERIRELRDGIRGREGDYIDRTIETVRNHRSADNCWPQWANIFADEIERLRRVAGSSLDVVEAAAALRDSLVAADYHDAAECAFCGSQCGQTMADTMLEIHRAFERLAMLAPAPPAFLTNTAEYVAALAEVKRILDMPDRGQP